MKIQIPLGLLQRGVIGRFSLGYVNTIPDGFFVGPKTITDSSGGSRGGARGRGAPPLFLDQTEARRAKKKMFLRTPPLPPPYLRIWIPHWIGLLFTHFGAIAVTKQSYVAPISKKESLDSYNILNSANRILQC